MVSKFLCVFTRCMRDGEVIVASKGIREISFPSLPPFPLPPPPSPFSTHPRRHWCGRAGETDEIASARPGRMFESPP